MDDDATVRAEGAAATAPVPGVWRLALGTPAVMLAYTLPLGIGAAVGSVGRLWAAPAGWVRIQNGDVVLASDVPLWWSALWIVLALLGHGFGLTAATRAAVLAAHGEGASLRRTFGAVARRPGTVAIACVAPLAVVAAAFACSALVASVPVIGWVLTIALLLTAAWALPLLLAWPAFVMRAGDGKRAVTEAFGAMTDELRPTRVAQRRLLLLAVAGAGASWGSSAVVGLIPGAPFGPATVEALRYLVAAIVALLGIAVVVTEALRCFPSLTALAAQAAQPARAAGGRAASHVTTTGARAGGWAALAGAPLVALLFAVAHPPAVVDTNVVATGPVHDQAFVVGIGDGTLASSALRGYERRFSLCDSAACARASSLGPFASAPTARSDGSAFLAHVGHTSEGFELRGMVVDRAGLTARDGDDRLPIVPRRTTVLVPVPADERSVSGVDRRSNGQQMTLAAVDGRDGPVIAWMMNDSTTVAGSDATTLRVTFCADADCASSTTAETLVPSRVVVTTAIRVAVAEDTAVVTIGGNASYTDTAQVVTLAKDGTTTRTVLVGPNPDSGHALDDAPVPVAIGRDGLPRLLYRAGADSALTYARCSDLACTSAERARIAVADTARMPLSFLLDATDRPLIPLRTLSPAALSVLSCLDATCTATQQKVLVETLPTPAESTPLGTRTAEIGIGRDGLPAVLTDAVPRSRSGGLWLGSLVTCSQARCGTD